MREEYECDMIIIRFYSIMKDFMKNFKFSMMYEEDLKLCNVLCCIWIVVIFLWKFCVEIVLKLFNFLKNIIVRLLLFCNI